MGTRFVLSLTILLGLISTGISQTLLVEAESFSEPGGWKLDTQFIHEMGSPYLLAHGLGKPVADAKTTIDFRGDGTLQRLGPHKRLGGTLEGTGPTWEI